MKYGDESYLNEVKLAKNDADYSPCEALLAAEAECEKLRNCPNEFWECAREIKRITSEHEKLKSALEQIASCEPYHPDTIVGIARKALGKA